MEKVEKYLDDKNPQSLSGVLVRIINPEEGVDIHHENHMFGKPFILKRGESKKVDKVIAESAVYMWKFLKMQKLAVEEDGYDSRIAETHALPTEYKYPEYEDIQDAKLDCDAYQFHILQSLATKLKVKGAMLCKKEALYKKIQEKSNMEILKALQALKVPANFINLNVLDNE